MKQTLLTICLIVFALPSWGNNVVCNLTGFSCPEIDNFEISSEHTLSNNQLDHLDKDLVDQIDLLHQVCNFD